MANELHGSGAAGGDFRNGLHSGAGALSGRKGEAPASAPVPCTPDTEEWINEGGSTAPPAGGPKAAHDTESGCRERAAADVSLAEEADTENGRIRLERSSASWTARADDIHKLDEDAEGQRAADKALWDSEEPASAPDRPGDTA
jgi:hypothetical protein